MHSERVNDTGGSSTIANPDVPVTVVTTHNDVVVVRTSFTIWTGI